MKHRKSSERNHEAHCGRSDGVRWNGSHQTELETARHHISNRIVQDTYITIAGARKGTAVSKLRNVIVKDYGDYPDSVKKEFAGADACIWYGIKVVYGDNLVGLMSE